MRHRRYDIAFLSVEGIDLPLRAAYLLVVGADDVAQAQWECLAYAVGSAPIQRGSYQLEIRTLEERTLTAEGILVRSVDGAHVFRGMGLPQGVTDAEIS